MISCLMPTFNRYPSLTFLVNEAIESFLRQTYTDCELLICNDTPGQSIVFDNPRVRIFNLPYRLPTLSDKLQYLIDNAHGDIYCRWDDDDISLPWRLEYSMQKLRQQNKIEWRAANHWYSEANIIKQETKYPGNTHVMALFTRAALVAIGGQYPEKASGWEDQRFNELLNKAGYTGQGELVDVEDIYYIYRWSTGSQHLSGVGGGPTGLQSHYDRLGQQQIVSAEYRVTPFWRIDYVKAARQACTM